MENKKIVVSAKRLSKTFTTHENNLFSIKQYLQSIFKGRGKAKKIYALSDVNFDVYKGECFGVIGGNGSGKSTLLKLIMDSYRPDKGSTLTVNGKLMRLSLGMGFDPNLTARENIYVNGTILGLSFKKIGNIFEEIINFTELAEFIDVPVRHYSKGMLSRLKFAVAIHAETDILLIDEFFGGVGDLAFKKKSDEIFVKSFMNGKSIILVSHSMKTIQKHCHRVMLLDKGKQVMIGKPKEVIEEYKRRSAGKKNPLRDPTKLKPIL